MVHVWVVAWQRPAGLILLSLPPSPPLNRVTGDGGPSEGRFNRDRWNSTVRDEPSEVDHRCSGESGLGPDKSVLTEQNPVPGVHEASELVCLQQLTRFSFKTIFELCSCLLKKYNWSP